MLVIIKEICTFFVGGGVGIDEVLKSNLADESWKAFAKPEPTGFRVVFPAPVFNQTIDEY